MTCEFWSTESLKWDRASMSFVIFNDDKQQQTQSYYNERIYIYFILKSMFEM